VVEVGDRCEVELFDAQFGRHEERTTGEANIQSFPRGNECLTARCVKFATAEPKFTRMTIPKTMIEALVSGRKNGSIVLGCGGGFSPNGEVDWRAGGVADVSSSSPKCRWSKPTTARVP